MASPWLFFQMLKGRGREVCHQKCTPDQGSAYITTGSLSCLPCYNWENRLCGLYHCSFLMRTWDCAEFMDPLSRSMTTWREVNAEARHPYPQWPLSIQRRSPILTGYRDLLAIKYVSFTSQSRHTPNVSDSCSQRTQRKHTCAEQKSHSLERQKSRQYFHFLECSHGT